MLNPIRSAVRYAIAIAAATAGMSASVHAQQAPAGANEEPEEVIVTGSRIRRVDYETASPVQVVRRDDIEKVGATNMADVLRSVISADNQGSIPTAFSGGFAAGSSGISLRGLGVNSTLVLVNGRRMAQYGLADDGVRSFVDLNSIPFDAVERVEVLKDGGSAIYGSDAIAGVVNIILRENFEGVTVSGESGTSGDGDGNSYRLSALAGTGGDNWNAFVSVEGQRDDAIDQADRGSYLGTQDLRRFGWFDNRQGANAAGFGNWEEGVLFFSGVTPYGTIRQDPDEFVGRVNLQPCPEVDVNSGVCLYSTLPFIQIQPKVERLNVFAKGTLNFTDEVKGYTELGYFTSHVQSHGTPGGVNDNGVYDASNPNSPITHTTTLPGDHPDNPLGEDRTLSLLTAQLGGRDGEQKSKVFRGIVGIGGTVGDNWEWDTGLGYIRSELEDTNYGFVRYPVLQAALDAGTFRMDPSLNSQALLNEISPALTREPTSSVAMVDARVSGSLFDLPGGRFGLAVGTEFRKEKTDTPPVPFTDLGEIVGLGYSAFKKDREVYAGYVEAEAPVTTWLELNGAIRYDHYDDYGSSTTPKLGFKIKPFEQLLLRATYQEAFRAPGPAESGNSASFGFTNIGILTIGNPDLKPEEAKSYTFGVVYEPFTGTNISVDYYKIDRDNEIVAADQALVIGDLPTTGEVPNSSRPGALPNSQLFYDEDGRLATISAPFVNATSTKTDGLDFDIRQRINLGASGTLTASFIWTHIFSFERETPGGDALEYAGTHGPYVLSSAGGTPSDRGRLQMTWDYQSLSLTAAVNYVSSMDMIDHKGEELQDVGDGTWTTSTVEGFYPVANPDGKVCGVYNPDGTVRNGCEVDEFVTVDLRGTYALGDAIEFSAGVKNLLDKRAPFDPYTYGGLNYNPSFHQQGAIGRFFNVGMRYSFQ